MAQENHYNRFKLWSPPSKEQEEEDERQLLFLLGSSNRAKEFTCRYKSNNRFHMLWPTVYNSPYAAHDLYSYWNSYIKNMQAQGKASEGFPWVSYTGQITSSPESGVPTPMSQSNSFGVINDLLLSATSNLERAKEQLREAQEVQDAVLMLARRKATRQALHDLYAPDKETGLTSADHYLAYKKEQGEEPK